uniref:Extracellular calcium-sensing receptor-like n=1 Tax=Geotrypetes seraphini TaxID=260995 RepID=A0A6P8PWQ2_GEOSA|nr:extracellular calcium-sensing receptor-like [Geotrypetes seraphini]
MVRRCQATAKEKRKPYKVEEHKRARLHYQFYQWIQSMVFAIEEINRDPDLLPNVTLGFRIYDSCVALQRTLEGALWILSGRGKPILNYRCQDNQPLAAVIGESSSTRSILMARLLGLYRYPQISYFATSSFLSDRTHFPSFFRTIPSDSFQSQGLVQLVTYFGWTWVGLLATDNNYGQQGIQIIKRELVKAGVCIAFSETILTNLPNKNSMDIVRAIKNSTAVAILAFCTISNLIFVMDEVVWQNVTGKIWIASEAWSTSPLLSRQKYAVISGTIGFAVQRKEIIGFKEYLSRLHPARVPEDIFMQMFWQEARGCKWPVPEILLKSWNNSTKMCAGSEKTGNLQDSYTAKTDFRTTYIIYNAIYIIAHALQGLNSCQQGRGPFLRGTCANISEFRPWQNKIGEEVFFDSNGDPPARYEIVNWQLSPEGTIRHVKVGSYDSSAPPGQNLIVNASAILWTTGTTQIPLSECSRHCPPGYRKVALEGKPICCFQCDLCPLEQISNQTDSVECWKCSSDEWPNAKQNQCVQKSVVFLSYEEPLGATLAGASMIFSLFPVASLGLFICYRNTPIVKANNCNLSYLLLLALTFCFLCSLAFVGYPSPEKCLLRQAAFGISFALCISCVLAKTIMVVIAFNTIKPNSNFRRWVGPQLSYGVIGVCTSIQILVCSSWLILSPPFLEYNTNTHPGMIVLECNEGSPIAFWGMLGYLWLLATFNFIVAFLARKLPDSFNEAKFITFSMLAFLTVWLSFIPAYLSTRGKYMVAMEIFAILSSSCALMFCIFFPKCYFILVKPEMNIKSHLMRKDPSPGKRRD